MKKTLVVLLILAVVGGVFAQEITPFGNVRLDFGATINMGNDNERPPEWAFGLSGDATNFGVRGGGDDAGGEVLIRMDGNLRANGWVNIGPVQLAIGNGEFFGDWNGFGYKGESSYGFGNSALGGQNPWLKVSAAGLVVGFHEGGISGKFLASSAEPKKMWKLNDQGRPDYSKNAYAPFPAFFVGYDYTIEDVASFGAMFAGQFVGERFEDLPGAAKDKDGKFPLMFNVHGKLLMLDPVSIGLNLALFMAPTHAPELFGPMQGNPVVKFGSGKSTVLETKVSASIPLEPCTVGIIGAFVTDLASKNDGGASTGFKIGAGADFSIGDTGFSICPGLTYTNILKIHGEDAKTAYFDLGVSLGYSF